MQVEGAALYTDVHLWLWEERKGCGNRYEQRVMCKLLSSLLPFHCDISEQVLGEVGWRNCCVRLLRAEEKMPCSCLGEPDSKEARMRIWADSCVVLKSKLNPAANLFCEEPHRIC